jgi:cell division transport system permease protein
VSFRLRFFAGEAVSSLRNNFATTLAATVTVLIVLFWLGVFVSLGSYMYSKLEQVRSDVQVSVYLQDGVRPKQIDVLRQRLVHNPAVQRVTYISKADAIKEMRKRLGKDADILRDTGGTNFLPAKLDVKLRDPGQAKEVATSMRGRVGVEKGAGGVQYGEDRADRFLRTTAVIEAVIGGLILLLAVAAVLLIANTIRLSIFARRREIEVMKLVGATNWFVRLPFMLEGMICGLIGAVLSIGLLWLAYDLLLRDWLQSASSVSSAEVKALSFWLLALLLVAAGAGLGALGSGLTMRRFLRV